MPAQDEDGSGYITVDELRKGLSRCSVDPRATDVQRLVDHMDARQSGRQGASHLRYEEFVAAALDAQRTLTAQTLTNIFCAPPQIESPSLQLFQEIFLIPKLSAQSSARSCVLYGWAWAGTAPPRYTLSRVRRIV